MDSFEIAYQRYVAGRSEIDHEILRPILKRIVTEAQSIPTDRRSLKNAFLALATFLVSPEGRTIPYCKAVDYFFCDWDELWTPTIAHLPQEFKETIETAGTDLYAGINQPEYHTSPEEFLRIVGSLKGEAS